MIGGIDELKREFMEYIAFANAWAATVQRGNVYRQGATESEKAAVRAAAHAVVSKQAAQYKTPVYVSQHTENIRYLSDSISAFAEPSLRGGRFRIGSAQKVLNLYLKFLWCMDWITTPPHCPLDRMVQEQAGIHPPVAWTQLDDITDYLNALAALPPTNGALAEWELVAWSRAVAPARQSQQWN